MTILYILDPATVGGATKSFLGLLNEMQKRGGRPIVCIARDTVLASTLNKRGVTTILTGHHEMITSRTRDGYKAYWQNLKKCIRYGWHDYKALRTVLKAVKPEQIDLIHTNSARSDIGFYLAKKLKKPHIVHLREFGDLDYDCYPLNPFYIHYYNKYSSLFISVSNAVKKHWEQKGIISDKIRTIYNGVDGDSISVSSDIDKTKKVLKIVMSGSVMPAKGHHLAIQAIGMLPVNIKSNIYLTFIGWINPNYKKKLEEIEVRCNLINPVEFVGPNDNILQLLGNYQIGLMCSRSEGFGRVTAEYMHARLGIIASDSGANPELIENGKTGLLFKSGNAQSLSEAIITFYMNREFLVSCSKSAFEKAKLLFTTSKNADEIYEMYSVICAPYN